MNNCCKSSQLSLLLSVKEVVDKKLKVAKSKNPFGGFEDSTRAEIETLSDIQSLLDSEINKVKEL